MALVVQQLMVEADHVENTPLMSVNADTDDDEDDEHWFNMD